MAILIAVAGGLAGGLVGVGGGVLFVPALTIFLGLSQVEAESTSLLMIVIVALVGAYRQNGYGNVDLREALVIGALSPLGVLIGVAVANNVSERALQLSFAALALFFAARLVRRAPLRPELAVAAPIGYVSKRGFPDLGERRPAAALAGAGLLLPRLERRRRSASTALAAVADSLDAELVAQIDPEEFFDFQATRPTISLTEGQTRHIEWPQNNLYAARVPSADRDLVLFDGTEPNLRWRTFSEAIATAADALGAEMVITLGALIAEVSHTLPVPITGLASSEELVEELDLERSNYEGPTGIVGVVHDCCRQIGIDLGLALGGGPPLRRRRPQPEGGAGPDPPPRRADRDRRRGLRAGGGDRPSYEEQIGRAVAANPEIEELVERIEAEQVELLGDEGASCPRADTIAREFQHFLRQRGDEKN